MTKRLLVDATHAEEMRVAVVENNHLVDFDYESTLRKQLKGSIFLAKVTRVEPSLQAAFVNFGGNRHGFLPFSEIHPDYFRIPIADREALIEEQKAAMEALAAAEEAEDLEEEEGVSETVEDDFEEAADAEDGEADAEHDESDSSDDEDGAKAEGDTAPSGPRARHQSNRRGRGRRGRRGQPMRTRSVEIVGGDMAEGEQAVRPTLKKNYKIQEVVKRGQIMLVQAQKEERGNKGAAVTTYLSLPGRYCVLMPNSPRGGGVSRKIANFTERKRMREILKELSVPDGMSVILRTAGTERTKAEIKRDLDYLMRLWDEIRDLTLKSIAPACVYEEGSLIKRALRDIYTRDISEVIVSGDEAYKEAKRIMKMLMPSHVKKVKEFVTETTPLFQKYNVESQIAQISEPVATLKSGGYIVINPTEALVAVDVNSGRATKERHIEETALRTNMEAATEVARQLKLRDLGGLIVIDFIDMEDYRNNQKVEKRLKEALSGDRARIQIGRISNFGLLELSRQRLNPSVTEAQFKLCDHCHGFGYTRTTDSAAVIALRAVEERALSSKGRENLTVSMPNAVALYILNHKRPMLATIEQRHGILISIEVNEDLAPAGFEIAANGPSKAHAAAPDTDRDAVTETAVEHDDSDDDQDDAQETRQSSSNDTGDNRDRNDRRNRRTRRGRRGGRNRGDRNNNNNNRSENDGQTNDAPEAKSDNAHSVETAPLEPAKAESDTKEDKGKKPATKGRSRKAASTKKDEVKETAPKEDKAQEASEDKPAAKDKPAPKKKPAAKKKTAANDEKSESAPKAEKAEKAEKPAKKEYEVVNEAPEKKKRGWWSKNA